MKLAINKVRFFPGAYDDFRYPSVIAELQIDNHGQVAVANLGESPAITELSAIEQLSRRSEPESYNETLLHVVLMTIQALLTHFGFPRERELVIRSQREREHQNSVRIQLSCLSSQAFITATKLAWLALCHLRNTGHSLSLTAEESKRLVNNLRSYAPQGFNTRFMLNEAIRRDIPWSQLSNNYFQFGYGKRARLFDSSLSDITPHMGALIAGQKDLSQRFLRVAGFPVLPTRIVHSAAQAVAAAKDLGMPVVVKPSNTEGGQGVFALLDTEESIATAFEQVKKLSSRALIEPFFRGKDYRVHIVQNSVHGLIERQPACVIGDGIHSIQELIEIKNNERKNATDDRQYLHAIAINRELERVLGRQNLRLSDVPNADHWVRLSAICNVATGGEPIQLEIGDMHADNMQLCIDAAKLLRLDIAGVDLLIPDIGISWLESGAHICEINHKPQMFTSFFPPFFDAFFGNSNGRIPITLIIESNPELPTTRNFVTQLSKSHDNVCWVAPGLREINAASKGTHENVIESARHALLDPSVGALIVSLDGSIALGHGWPFNSCDDLILVASSLEAVDAIKKSSLYREICRSLDPTNIRIFDTSFVSE